MQKTTLVLGFLLVLLIPAGYGQSLAPLSMHLEPLLRDTVPLDTVVADLERYIPQRMEEVGIPGLSLALIREGQVAYAAGFGVAGTMTGTPVTPETVFEVASNSKVVTTYAALRLVEQGTLSLDEALSACFSEPWLPASPFADQITLRHVASHSAGLTDNLLPIDKRIAFEPGAAFSYSGVGFLYLQAAIEQVTGQSLENAARALVFEPLGMASSSFVNRADLTPHRANGHMSYAFPLLSFLIPFAGILFVVVLVGMVIRRLRAGTWRLSSAMGLGACGVAALLTLVLVYLTLGRALPNVALLTALCAAAFAVVLAMAVFVGWKMIDRLPAQERLRRPLRVLWGALSVVVLLWLSGMIAGPMPRGPSPPPSAVGSLRTTAPDLAAFLIELAAPRLLSEETAAQIRTPQMAIDDDFSWGLGIGIQHSDQGEALWQNGMTFGFRSVMVIYPERQWGVVVLTNSHDGLLVAYDVVARALGGKAQWQFF